MAKKLVLVKRRAKRGRPRLTEASAKMKTMPVFVARDPQGVKLFAKKPALSVLGLWEGTLIPGASKPLEPRVFVTKYRNAQLPSRGSVLEVTMGV